MNSNMCEQILGRRAIIGEKLGRRIYSIGFVLAHADDVRLQTNFLLGHQKVLPIMFVFTDSEIYILK